MLDPSLLAIHRIVWGSLLAALIAMGAYVHVPLGPVPISLQTFFVLLAGYVLGPVHGALAVALYLAAGLLGLPVFAGGTSGLARLLGPTGGFLAGFLPLAAVAGMATRGRRGGLTWQRGLLWGFVALAVTYALGLARLKAALGMEWGEAVSIGLLPFLPGAAAKLALAVATYRFMDRRSLLPP